MDGIVIQSTGSWYEVDVGGRRYRARLRGRFRQDIRLKANPLAVGDRVSLEPEEGGEGTAVITEIAPRTNHIVRRSPRSERHEQVVAANLDQAFLVVTLSRPRTSLGFVDRFLVNTNTYDIPASLVFNKADALSEKETVRQDAIRELYASLGYPGLRTSAKTGEGLDAFREALAGRVTLLAGHSGVGKSSLANALEPGLGLRVRKVSEASGKGKHATTFATMHPLSFGGWIVDTPGIKEFGIVDLEPQEVAHYFPEFAERIEHCRFHNCMHLSEPDCAVLEAVAQGLIAGSRYNSYLSILEDAGRESWD